MKLRPLARSVNCAASLKKGKSEPIERPAYSCGNRFVFMFLFTPRWGSRSGLWLMYTLSCDL